MCLSGGGGGAKTPTLDPVCIRETPEKMIVWSLPPQMKNPRYGPVDCYTGELLLFPVMTTGEYELTLQSWNTLFHLSQALM